MTDEAITQAPTNNTDMQFLLKQNGELLAKVSVLESDIAKLRPLVEEVKVYKDNFTTVNGQLETLKGQHATVQAEYDSTRNQFMDVSGKLTNAQQELNVWNIVKSDPDASLLMPIMDTIARDPDLERQKAIIAQHRDYLKAISNQSQAATVKAMQAGEVPTQARATETAPQFTKSDLWRMAQNPKDKNAQATAYNLLMQQTKATPPQQH